MNLDGGKAAEQERERAAEQERERAAQQEQERQKAAQQEQERSAQQEQERERARQRAITEFGRLARFVGVKVTDDKLYTSEIENVCKASVEGFAQMKKALLNARERARELEAYQTQCGDAESFRRWRAAQKQGRAQKAVDWGRYEKLVAARVPQKDIARYLGMSANTLRKCVKERAKQ